MIADSVCSGMETQDNEIRSVLETNTWIENSGINVKQGGSLSLVSLETLTNPCSNCDEFDFKVV